MLDNGNTPHILDFGEPEKENMIGHKLGEFAPTRTFRSHAGASKVAKK